MSNYSYLDNFKFDPSTDSYKSRSIVKRLRITANRNERRIQTGHLRIIGIGSTSVFLLRQHDVKYPCLGTVESLIETRFPHVSTIRTDPK